MEGEKDLSKYSLSCKIDTSQKGKWLEARRIDCGGRNILFESRMYQNDTIYFTKNSRFDYTLLRLISEGKSRFVKKYRRTQEEALVIRVAKWAYFHEKKRICLVKLLKGVFMVWVLREFNLGS